MVRWHTGLVPGEDSFPGQQAGLLDVSSQRGESESAQALWFLF